MAKNALDLTVLSATLTPSCVMLVAFPRMPCTNESLVLPGFTIPAIPLIRSKGLRAGNAVLDFGAIGLHHRLLRGNHHFRANRGDAQIDVHVRGLRYVHLHAI